MGSSVHIGLTSETEKLLSNRAAYSQSKIQTVEASLISSNNIREAGDICIFTAGSYGRLEASEHSDIDLFFIRRGPPPQDHNLNSILLFSDIIDTGRRLGFPKFSNDGEYLKILSSDEMLRTIGSRDDDFKNHFTARMLFLLESRCLYGHQIYDEVKYEVIDSYFRDYRHHPHDFKPTFLVNDIIRFWKTLCLNYENSRNGLNDRDKIKQKIKNYKLKYSRLMTCFATICRLATYSSTISPNDVLTICLQTPSERFRALSDFDVSLRPKLSAALENYSQFLLMTQRTKEDLESVFSDEGMRDKLFAQAQQFGDLVYDVIFEVSRKNNALRYMVV